MADATAVRGLGRLLGSAGRAHHAEVGGPNEGWPEWYAERLHPDIGDHVGFTPTVEDVASWLREADRRHRDEAPEQPWPTFYATHILETHAR